MGSVFFTLCPTLDTEPPHHLPPCRWVPWWERSLTPVQPSHAELRCHQGITEHASAATCRGRFRVPLACAPPLLGRATSYLSFPMTFRVVCRILAPLPQSKPPKLSVLPGRQWLTWHLYVCLDGCAPKVSSLGPVRALFLACIE